MLFNSLAFLGFAGLFYLLWPAFRRRDLPRWSFITLASFVFYGWWDPRYLALMAASGLVDFFAALWIADRPRVRKVGLVVSLAANLGLLAAFKYAGFLAENVAAVRVLLGGEPAAPASVPDFMSEVPPGISFYTFQSMSYLIDVYRGEIRPTRNVLHFFAYLAAFPQLVAGPVVRAADLLPSMRGYRPLSERDRFEGLRWIVLGFFKKCVLADNLAPMVDRAFSHPAELSWAGSWGAVSLFAFQIYFDFSGYSNIARGLMRWMGYAIPVNFDHPYHAGSFRGFWQRWHISLSTWFRDYLYIPLGGGRGGPWKTTRNLWITFLVAGLWHGAAWTYVVWGAWSAFCLTIERVVASRGPSPVPAWRRLGGWAATLAGVWIGWAMFRSASISDAASLVGAMLDPFRTGEGAGRWAWLMIGAAAGLEFLGPLAARAAATAWEGRLVRLLPLGLAALIVATVFLRGPSGAFIYFQF